MLLMCVLTVCRETDSSPAISDLDRFVGRYRSTLSSPGLSSSVSGGADWSLAARDELCTRSRMSASSAACAVSCRGSVSSSSAEPVITNGSTTLSCSAIVILDVGGLAVQHLGEQVLGDHVVAAGELRDEPLRIRVPGQRDRREPQARGPPLRPLLQQRRAGLGQRDTRGIKQLAGLAFGEPQIRRADLGQLAGQAQLMQAQPQIATRGQYRMPIWGKAGQQPGELGEGLRRIQLVQIINHQRDAVASIGEF